MCFTIKTVLKLKKKFMKKLLFTLGLGLVCLFSATQVSAQTKETRQEKKEQREKRDKTAQIKQAQKNVANIEALNFSFYPNALEAQFGVSTPIMSLGNPANPNSMANGDYYFTVDKSDFYLNLPYIGRFYATPMNPENRDINLTCSKFLYDVHSTDGINIQVTIIPSENTILNYMNDDIKFVFNLNKNTGYAKLVVTSQNRQEMTYTGTFN